ncbi:MFS general substrate transporter [Chloropicon primus]|uniref:MFS general substrate transporter n=1 Tax=Chloropicon primus TaxID=1764295 RepID=A0A5B8MGY7_9CHLO|nr:MFS general substrate transporter [Chloropicon primus]UPQ99169.1 MFS general substrate transporter [Chloropicon primus]|eukprot:QDZ19958.1 MFS general substrate transporter [Chloropicon primus]
MATKGVEYSAVGKGGKGGFERIGHDYRRFGSLLSALYLELLGGGVYAFSVYSGKLHQLGLRQEEVQVIGTSGNLGAWLLLPAGYIFDRYGPSNGILVGSALTATGYFILYLVLTGRIETSVPMLCLGTFMAQNGGGFWDGSALPMATKNFAPDKGLIVGLLKGFWGISASVITVLYQSYFRPNISSFMLMMAIGLPAGALATLHTANVSPKADVKPLTLEERARICFFGYGLLGALVVYVSSSSIFQKDASYPILGNVLIILIAFCGVLYFPTKVPGSIGRKLGLGLTKSHELKLSDLEEEDEDKEMQDATLLPMVQVQPEPALEYAEVMRSKEFWLLFTVMVIVQGAGITLFNNVGELVEALDGESGARDSYVVLLSVGNCLGRALIGICSDLYSNVWSKATFVLFISVVMMVNMLALAIPSLNLLYLSCLVCGTTFGASSTLMPVTLADLYGQENFGKLLGTAMFAPMLGSTFFSTLLSSAMYNYYMPKDGEAHFVCKGGKCFGSTFLIMAGLCFGASLMSFYLKKITDGRNRG